MNSVGTFLSEVKPEQVSRPWPGCVPYGLRKFIEAVKTGVPIEQYLQDRGVEIKRARARCIVHNEDNVQAFSVNHERQRWHCFRCNEGGDVIDLCRAVEGGEDWESIITLAIRYGVELPGRPERWHNWQNDKEEHRQALREVIAESYRRRYFRVFYSEYLRELDPEVRESEAEELWRGLKPLAFACAELRINR